MSRKLRYIYIVILFGASQIGHSQYAHEDVFSEFEQNELYELLIQNFKPSTVLDYGVARDLMYSEIYNIDDTVSCIYTDHKLYLDPSEDPSTFLYMNGIADGINAEHSYPQSKGAANGNARSDMHHLFPSRTSANSERGSMPFGEVNDNITEKWFYKTQENNFKPSVAVIDLYSEKGGDRWEPRESVKGDVARAIFYFYTMYRDQAIGADPDFFEAQRETLCGWHNEDVVDSLEWIRNQQIAIHQDGKTNPFILDCSLASRIYCDELTPACQMVDVDPINTDVRFDLVQNPVRDFMEFDCHVYNPGNYKLEIIDISTGRLVYDGIYFLASSQKIIIETNTMHSGTYVARWSTDSDYTLMSDPILFIKLNH